jgi:hypothetical protein
LYELLTGRPPFLGEMWEVIYRVIHHQPDPPRRMQPELPKDLERICLTCLHKDPTRRFGSAAQLAEELGQIDPRALRSDAAGDDKRRKPLLTLEGEAAEAFDDFASADAIFKMARSNQEAAKARAGEAVRAYYLRLCVESGTADNPAIATSTSTANYLVKHVGKLSLTAGPNGETISVQDQLRQLGFDDDVIQTILTKVIKQESHWCLKKLTDLQGDRSTPAQRAVADKIMMLVQQHLSDEERALCLEESVETTVDEGWKDLAVQLAIQSGGGDTDKAAEALAKLYSVLPPQFVLTHMIFRGELTTAFGKLQVPPSA